MITRIERYHKGKSWNYDYYRRLGTTVLVELLGQHLASDLVPGGYMQKVYDEIYNISSGNHTKPILTLVE